MQCHQIAITGSGSDFPEASSLVAIPGAYKANDPGILVNIYPFKGTYVIRKSPHRCSMFADGQQLDRLSGPAALRAHRLRPRATLPRFPRKLRLRMTATPPQRERLEAGPLPVDRLRMPDQAKAAPKMPNRRLAGDRRLLGQPRLPGSMKTSTSVTTTHPRLVRTRAFLPVADWLLAIRSELLCGMTVLAATTLSVPRLRCHFPPEASWRCYRLWQL
jgi:hypothetical protein